MISVIFVVFSLPPYLSGDPARSRVPQPDSLGLLHFWILVPHVIFGAVALLTACLQIWPWLRRHHPAVHRRIGRIYVFGGVLPAGIAGLFIGAFTPYGPVAKVSNLLLAVLWLTFTITGWRMARQRRFADHRRWMIRSFALTASIITNRIWGAIAYITLTPQLDTTFGGNEQLFSWTVAGLTTWVGWTIPLLISQWWLERSPKRRAAAPLSPQTPPTAGADEPDRSDTLRPWTTTVSG
jgi:uncharacterized membrane protein YozB (DUF420 family)